MKKLIFILIVLSVIISCKTTKELQKEQNITINYPKTNKVDIVTNYFGADVKDPYRWLEDDRSKETEEWVRNQNQTTSGYLENIPYREELKERLEQIYLIRLFSY